MRLSQREKGEVRAYVEDQAHEQVIHLEKVASELVGPVRHDIWDVHCTESRWWVVTEPINLYSQADFKSRDVVLTFHIGLALRVSYLQEREVPVAPKPTDLLPGAWRRWQQAFETPVCETSGSASYEEPQLIALTSDAPPPPSRYPGSQDTQTHTEGVPHA